jgi:hypothetical protein
MNCQERVSPSQGLFILPYQDQQQRARPADLNLLTNRPRNLGSAEIMIQVTQAYEYKGLVIFANPESFEVLK